MLNEHMVENRYHNYVFPFVRLGHLVMAALGVLAEGAARGEPLCGCKQRSCCIELNGHTREAASSVRDEIYRVATTVSPSVTQKFIKLGYRNVSYP